MWNSFALAVQALTRLPTLADARSDRQRDAITKAAGYQTLRFQSKHKPSVKELAEMLTKLVATQQTA